MRFRHGFPHHHRHWREGGFEHRGRRGRGGRFFDQGDLRLVILALLAEQPRHGYEIIKAIEAATSRPVTPSGN